MTRSASPDGPALFPLPAVAPIPVLAPGRRKTGRHERHLEKSLRVAGLADSRLSAASVSMARALSRSLDLAEAKGDAYLAPQVVKPYMELLTRLGLLEDREGTGTDDTFSGMGSPEIPDS